MKVLGYSADEAADNAAFRTKFAMPFDLVSDPGAAGARALGAWGPQEWKGQKYDGLTRCTIVIGADGVVKGVISGVKPEEHAAAALKILAS